MPARRTPADYRVAAARGELSAAYAERMARAIERSGARRASTDLRRRARGQALKPTTESAYDRQRLRFLRLAAGHTGRSVADLASDSEFNERYRKAFGGRR